MSNKVAITSLSFITRRGNYVSRLVKLKRGKTFAIPFLVRFWGKRSALIIKGRSALEKQTETSMRVLVGLMFAIGCSALTSPSVLQNSKTAKQQNSKTAKQQNSKTAKQQNSKTAKQQNSIEWLRFTKVKSIENSQK